MLAALAYGKEVVDVEREVCGCYACIFWDGEDGEDDAVRGFEDLEKMVVSTSREVWNCGADEEVLAEFRRQDRSKEFCCVEEVQIKTPFKRMSRDLAQFVGFDAFQEVLREIWVLGEDVYRGQCHEHVLGRRIRANARRDEVKVAQDME